MNADTHDPEAFAAAVSRLPREAGRFAKAAVRLMGVVKQRAALADTQLPPAEKVVHLAAAKLALAELEACLADAPGFELYGVESAKRQLQTLEQTFTAFGYYRSPSVVSGAARRLGGGGIQ